MFKSLRQKLISKTRQDKIKTYEGLKAGLTEVRPLAKGLQKNLQAFRDIFNRCSDVKYRSFEVNTSPPVDAALVYLDGMVDKELVNDHILSSLMYKKNIKALSAGDLYYQIKDTVLSSIEVREADDLVEASDWALAGDAVLLIDGYAKSLIIGAKGFEMRSVEESASEQVIRGPRDGFVENLRTNTTLLRRRIKSSRLKMEVFKAGAVSNTDIVIAYIEGIAAPGVVEEVKKRLTRIDIDGVLGSSYAEEFMEDVPWSPFPQINSTERPDKVAAGLLEGQVAVIVDNTPFVLLMPVTFPQFLQAAEDYYDRYFYASFFRLIRFVALNVALLLPALYIAIVTFHQEMLPTSLLLSLAAGREGVPFPAFIEALLMELTFEILREAGLRLPRPVGQATSIVGALVIGQSAVNAGLVSPAMVIVVALTALAGFIIPTVPGAFAVRILRFPIMFLAAALGLFGIMTALMAMLIHLCSLRSFGVPYLSPLVPLETSALKDGFVRVPRWMMITRPRFLSHQEPRRADRRQKPHPPRQADSKKPGGKNGGDS